MGKAARAIIIENNTLLLMHRNKYGSEYYTLVGGRAKDDEPLEEALVREVFEETGLTVTAAQLVYIELHRPPHNEQYIYLCNVAPHADVALRADSEEAQMNRFDLNTHTPMWVRVSSFQHLTFRSVPLHNAIVQAFQKGFPKEPVTL